MTDKYGVTAATIALDQIAYRSDSIIALATETIARVREHPAVSLPIRYYTVLRLLKSVDTGSEDILAQYYAPDNIRALESSQEAVRRLAGSSRQLHIKLVDVLESIHTLDDKLGYWRRLYAPHIASLEKSTVQFGALADALEKQDAPLLLLSKPAQTELVRSLLNPPAANNALVAAFTRK